MKKEKIYTDWRNGVFNKVQSSVNKHIENTDHKALHRLRRERYQKYLDDANTASGVFLDKNPPPQRANKVSVGRLHDPTLRIVQRRTEEAKMLRGTQSGVPIMSSNAGKVNTCTHNNIVKYKSDVNIH